MSAQPHSDTQMPLLVSGVDLVADGIRSFELVQPDGSPLPEFSPGSHVKVQTPSGTLRKYSLCNAPHERHRYLIAVKREAEGRGGSLSMHDNLRKGDTLLTSLPENAFPLVPGPKGYLFIAGGIGITPILSMIRSLEEMPPARWRLIYLTRSPETTAFLTELTGPELGAKVRVHHDHADASSAFDLWPMLEKPNTAHVYCCGPRPLMEAVRDMSGHWSRGNVHFESFSEGGQARPDDRPFKVVLARSQTAYEVSVGKSILEVLREHGHNHSSSCESGTCGTCRTRLISGEADHRDMVLMPEELATQIMICISRSKSMELVLDL